MKDRKAVLEDGTIAGSATNLYECMKCVIGMGVPEHAAIFAATRIRPGALGFMMKWDHLCLERERIL